MRKRMIFAGWVALFAVLTMAALAIGLLAVVLAVLDRQTWPALTCAVLMLGLTYVAAIVSERVGEAWRALRPVELVPETNMSGLVHVDSREPRLSDTEYWRLLDRYERERNDRRLANRWASERRAAPMEGHESHG